MEWFLNLLKSLAGSEQGRQLLFADGGRSGQVIYIDKIGRLEFYFEFAGGNCLAIVTVPSTSEWHRATGRPADTRYEILTYIAEQIIIQKAPGHRYKIIEDAIEILSTWKGGEYVKHFIKI